MANQVYANNREIACKKASGKSICAFPDVCFTPPQTPATPPGVPIPYPNTGMASDTTNGSKKTKISDKEIMLKNQSDFKTSYGDEAGCAPKKGLITSKNQGKIYFKSWSMDVKIEGKNAVRHLDLTTHNHASDTGNTPPWCYTDRMKMAERAGKDCDIERNAVSKEKCVKDGKVACPDSKEYLEAKKLNDIARQALKTVKKSGSPATIAAKEAEKRATQDAFNKEHMAYSKKIREDHCNKAARCMLVPWKPSKCCAPQTPHHLVPKASFFKTTVKKGSKRDGCQKYNKYNAPCICATGGKSSGAHGAIHAKHAELAKQKFPNNTTYTCSQAENIASEAANKMFPQCSAPCIEAQLRKIHRENGGVEKDTPIKISCENPADASKLIGEWMQK